MNSLNRSKTNWSDGMLVETNSVCRFEKQPCFLRGRHTGTYLDQKRVLREHVLT